MSAEVEVRPASGDASWDDDDLFHGWCDCNPDVAFCGHRFKSEVVYLSVPADLECVVCLDLCGLPCVRCGGLPPD